LSELIYSALLLLAVAGVWVLRMRPVLMTIGLLLFPLPATLLRYFEAPQSVIEKPQGATPRADSSRTSGGKNVTPGVHIDAPRPADGAPVAAAPHFEGGRRVDQELPSAPPPQDDATAFLNASLLLVSTVVTYLSVWLGVGAGAIVYRILAGERPRAGLAKGQANSAEPQNSDTSRRRRTASSRPTGAPTAASLLDRGSAAEGDSRLRNSTVHAERGEPGLPDGTQYRDYGRVD
jgi:hypothetical protein